MLFLIRVASFVVHISFNTGSFFNINLLNKIFLRCIYYIINKVVS